MKFVETQWPMNVANVLKIEKVPDDFEATLHYIIYDTMGVRERDALLRRYKAGQTLKEIGIAYGFSKQRAQIVVQQAVNKLSTPSRLRVLTAGLDAYTQQRIKEQAARRADPDDEDERETVDDGTKHADDGVASMSIDELALSKRAYNCLRHAHVNTVGKLYALNAVQLYRIRGLGTVMGDEIISTLERLGLDCGHMRIQPEALK